MDTTRTTRAMGATVAVLGSLTALAGLEHGIGEVLQGNRRPASPFIESWPDAAALEVLAGEPALTLFPSLLIAGLATVAVAVLLGSWAVMLGVRGVGLPRRAGTVLSGLSVLLLLVGGGFGPPLIGLLCGAALVAGPAGPPHGGARRALAASWRPVLVTTVLAYLALMPGVVVASLLTDAALTTPVAVLSVGSFVGVVLSLAAARARDALASAQAEPVPMTPGV